MAVTILVVEDHSANRTLLRRRLERLGYETLEAANGAEAVALVLERRPDVVLMDLSLPIMDGIEAWRTICEMSKTPPAAIALTASTISDVRMTCDEIGFSAYITKPCNFTDLCKTIERVSVGSATAVAR